MDILPKILNPGFAFVITLVFGFWLSRRGKPYNGLLFNIHKLIALGTMILATVMVCRALKVLDLGAVTISSLVIAGISVIVLFASGILMSANKGEYRVMKLVPGRTVPK